MSGSMINIHSCIERLGWRLEEEESLGDRVVVVVVYRRNESVILSLLLLSLSLSGAHSPRLVWRFAANGGGQQVYCMLGSHRCCVGCDSTKVQRVLELYLRCYSWRVVRQCR